MSGRRIFVGDIQGCRAELDELLELLRFDIGSDELYPLGDVVNRGPDSLGTLRLLHSVEALPVLGNHDLHLLAVAHGRREAKGKDTLREILRAPDGEELLEWVRSWPFLRVLGDLVVVHAGIAPSWTADIAAAERELATVDPLDPGADGEFATYTRYCDADGVRTRADPPPPEERDRFKPWDAFLPMDFRARHTVVFGHWAQRGLVVKPGLRGIDTGCVWGDRLTAWIAEEDRLVHVAAHETYRQPGGG